MSAREVSASGTSGGSGERVSPDDSVAFGATFGFAGEGPEVRPTDAVDGVEREDGTLTVRGDFDGNRPRAFEVSFVDAGGATLLAEHVRLTPALRNAIPYAATEGVDTVRYVADESVVETAVQYLDAVAPDATRYRFRDYRFEVGETVP